VKAYTLPPTPHEGEMHGIRFVIDPGPALRDLIDLDSIRPEHDGEIRLAPGWGYIEPDGYSGRGDTYSGYVAHAGEYLLVQFDDDRWAVTSPDGLAAYLRLSGQPGPIEIGG
jgi:hypothetical protein